MRMWQEKPPVPSAGGSVNDHGLLPVAEPLENKHTASVKCQAVQPQKRLKHRDHPADLELVRKENFDEA